MTDTFVFKKPIAAVVDNGSGMFQPPMPAFEDPSFGKKLPGVVSYDYADTGSLVPVAFEDPSFGKKAPPVFEDPSFGFLPPAFEDPSFG
ncbi:hypothetical protein [Mameliella sediminis]|uniref:hypothetical protein n=1 Tax=Mameliella sediminis TaxID=2836866 RepID=UPI001C474174|nr:hypothetical protein [Mameliella sediminis]MBY6117245.1 hypothetical protein [Antarctobacter heliothermus]MBY6147101.1 hypothetical protein [Mameliella alba]MBV7397088.1 hypothetical protein [Mameliella sediminis]MBY6161957.1 hypothetical protein [Mameliella alba]MBY6170427.1 hypothetical protein [Mameliella alba]